MSGDSIPAVPLPASSCGMACDLNFHQTGSDTIDDSAVLQDFLGAVEMANNGLLPVSAAAQA